MTTENRRKPPLPRPHHAPATPGKPRVKVKFVQVLIDKKEKQKVNLVVTPFAPVPSDQDTDLFIIAVINGSAIPELDANTGPVTIPVNPGDTYDVAQQDKNVVGLSGISPHVTGTVPPAPPTSVPQTPGAPGVAITA